MQGLLDPSTTLLSYVVTPDVTLAFVVTRDGFQEVDLPVRRQDLQAAIADFRGFNDRGDAPSPSLQQLYAWLIAPLSEQLTTSLVVIIPSDILNYLPFTALTDGEHYFGEQHTLFELPSASTLPFIQQKRKGHAETLLALSENQGTGLATLQFADQEVQSIAALYKTRPLTGSEATETAFKAQAGSYSILHLAAHAELNAAAPLLSHIFLAPGGGDDGLLDVQEVYGLNLGQADLVVLSACETQLSGKNQGEDFVGLNRAFIYAGTPSVIASLWAVDDEATSVLMVAFYQHLQAGMGKAEALQAAQAETRLRFPNPYFWAAFVLTGDPGPSAPDRP